MTSGRSGYTNLTPRSAMFPSTLAGLSPAAGKAISRKTAGQLAWVGMHRLAMTERRHSRVHPCTRAASGAFACQGQPCTQRLELHSIRSWLLAALSQGRYPYKQVDARRKKPIPPGSEESMADGLSMMANTRCTAPEALLMSGKVTLACAMPIAASRIARKTCNL